METKGIFQFESIKKISFWFILIPMLYVYGHHKYVYSYSAGIDFGRQNLTSKVDPRAERVEW